MNKKFSTLVAVLLAAGAWTTLDAKVVVTTGTPAAGSYAIGTTLEREAVTLELGTFHEAVQPKGEVNEIASVNGKAGTEFTNVTQWTFISESIDESATMQTEIDGKKYYLCYDAERIDEEFYLSADGEESNTNLLKVKVSSANILTVDDAKALSIAGGVVSLVETNEAPDFIWVTSDEPDEAAVSADADTPYVLATAADLTQGGTYYLTGNFEAEVKAEAAYYELKKAESGATIEDASKDIWTVTAVDGGFTLSTTVTGANEGTYAVVADSQTGILTAVEDGVATAFMLAENGELLSADDAKEFDWSSTLGMITKDEKDDNAIQFGQWEDVETPPVVETPSELPGLTGVTVGEDGMVTELPTAAPGATVTVAAPFYFKAGTDGADQPKDVYLAYDGKKLVKIVGEPNAAQALSASWKVEGGKLISLAAKRANKDVALAVASTLPQTASLALTKANDDPVVVGELKFSTAAKSDAPVVTIVPGDGLKLGEVTISDGGLAVSNVSVDVAKDKIYISDNGTVVAGTQKNSYQSLLTSVTSDYSLVAVYNGDDATVAPLFLQAQSDGSAKAVAFDPAEYKSFLWKIGESNDNKTVYYYTFTSMLTNNKNEAIQWIVDGKGQFSSAAQYNGNGFTLSHVSGNVALDLTDGIKLEADAKKAIIAFYEAPLAAMAYDKLNGILNPGFEMTVEIEEDSEDVLENIDIFSGKMYPEETSTSNVYKIWNNKEFGGEKATDPKILVLNTEKISGDNAVGAFAWVTKKEYDKDQATGGDKKYEANFKFLYDLATPSTDVLSKVMVGEYTLSVLEVDKKFYLTSVITVTDKTKLPYIKLGANNIYPVKKLLGKLWNITYANTKANAKAENEEYKLNGILAVTYDKGTYYPWNANTEVYEEKNIPSVADYVASSTVAESAPEAQWMVTSANLNTNRFTLTNRENPAVQITGVQLRVRDNDKFEVYITPDAVIDGVAQYSTSETNLKGDENASANDIVYVTESKKKDNFQGYMQTTENTLRSNNYFLGQYHAIGGNNNAYFVENHANSHQIGAVATQEDADKWKLHFATTKDDDDKTVVDTVYVITRFATLNAKGDGWESDSKKIKKDTLAILPYTFQKVANREFVAFNSTKNFDFYACDASNHETPNKAARFALKAKANGTYNFVELADINPDANIVTWGLSSDKVYMANSADKGSLKRMQTYAADENSLMVVEPADASEYHKIAVEWGDTISLYREDNKAQVVYEKHDNKSVVDKETLSFLNIDNINQFSVNPAIFADTAYINRWDADGVLNTTYQYLLAVNPSFGYHVENCNNPTHDPEISNQVDTVYGRFLVNLIDTANVYGVNHIHSNVYTNESEAGEKLAKLSFVEGFHTNDTLYLTRKGGETVKIGMTDPAFNVAKFAFRYVDSEAKTFKIQTIWKRYLGNLNTYETAEDFAAAYKKNADNADWVSSEGYLKWINGTVVVTKGYENGDVFGIEENVKRDPVANESINGAASFSVATIDGAVVISGAEGKNVTISNVLGQPVASTVITSSEATISVPAGVVIVAVEGEEAVKAIVK